MAGDLERAIAFLKGIDERASASVERFQFGRAYLRPELPRVWSRNFVWVDSEIGEQELDPLLHDVDRIHAGVGLSHRRIVFEHDSGGASVGPLLADRGWRVDASRVMLFDGPPPTAASGSPVQEVDGRELRTASAAVGRADPGTTGGEETIEQLGRAAEAVAGAIAERCFAAVVDGRIVSYCRLYSDGATGQIEEIGTVPELRGRGYSRAVVTRAIADSASAHDLTFLLADEGEWPSRWYERLGFRPSGLLREAVISQT